VWYIFQKTRFLEWIPQYEKRHLRCRTIALINNINVVSIIYNISGNQHHLLRRLPGIGATTSSHRRSHVSVGEVGDMDDMEDDDYALEPLLPVVSYQRIQLSALPCQRFHSAAPTLSRMPATFYPCSLPLRRTDLSPGYIRQPCRHLPPSLRSYVSLRLSRPRLIIPFSPTDPILDACNLLSLQPTPSKNRFVAKLYQTALSLSPAVVAQLRLPTPIPSPPNHTLQPHRPYLGRLQPSFSKLTHSIHSLDATCRFCGPWKNVRGSNPFWLAPGTYCPTSVHTA
jgi:hypothetical protein